MPTPSLQVPGTSAAGAPVLDESALVPMRIRRLSNVELGNSIRSLLHTDERYEDALPADLRQNNFTVNEAQVASSDWSAALERIAQSAAARAALDLDPLSPCPGETSEACAEEFIAQLAEAAFRRQTRPPELSELWAIYESGVAEAGFTRGMQVTIAALLQSPSFIYVTELGEFEDARASSDAEPPAERSATGTLTGDEIATSIAFITTSAPPDAELMQAGRDGSLLQGDARAAQARRLLSTEAGTTALQEMIVQWFAADSVLNAAKDDVPAFNQRRDLFLQESRDFARAVVQQHEADVVTLLTADFTVAEPSVSEFYGIGQSGTVSLADTPRRGITTQAAFLGGHSSPTQSSPVRRGAAFMRQVLCTEPPDPAAVGLMVAPPEPDPDLSTRQLFEAHSSDEQCRGCHSLIDPLGFAFEQFDEAGRVRQGPADNNGQPVDASGEVTLMGDRFEFDDAADLLRQIASSDLAQSCIAKTTARYAFATHDPAAEAMFVEVWRELDEARRTRLDEVLIKLVESDLFVRRRVQ